MKDNKKDLQSSKKPFKACDENGSLKQKRQTATLQVSKKKKKLWVKRRKRETRLFWMYILLWDRSKDMGYYSWRQQATFLFGSRKDPKISGGKETNIFQDVTFNFLKQIPEFIVSKPNLKTHKGFTATFNRRTSCCFDIYVKRAANRVTRAFFFGCLVVINWEEKKTSRWQLLDITERKKACWRCPWSSHNARV